MQVVNGQHYNSTQPVAKSTQPVAKALVEMVTVVTVE